MSQVFNETTHAGGFLLSEAELTRSREAIVIGASQSIVPGAVLGKLSADGTPTAAATADAGNTGDGAMTLAGTPTGAGAQAGDYRVVCNAAAAGGGSFSVEDPEGVNVGEAQVGAAFAGPIAFTIAAGGTDFAVGDAFTVAVAIPTGATGGQFVALDPSASDGSQHAAGIAYHGVITAAGETVNITGILRDAEVNQFELTWPAGITDPQKAAAVDELNAIGIFLR